MASDEHGLSLRRVIYSSETVVGRSPTLAELNRLMVGARHFNVMNGVTGMLWSDGARFVQAIEGTVPAIIDVLTRIKLDPLHHNVQIVIDMPVQERGFGDWAMALQTKDFTDEGDQLGVAEPVTVPPWWGDWRSWRSWGAFMAAAASGSAAAKVLLG